MQFRDRQEAGKALAKELAFLRGKPDVVVLAIPRGGVVVGYQVAKALQAPLDVYITRKIGAPYNAELAMGAVASDGSVFLDHELIQRLGVPADYLDKEIERQRNQSTSSPPMLGPSAGASTTPTLIRRSSASGRKSRGAYSDTVATVHHRI